MKFLTDHGAGHSLATWLIEQGNDVFPAQALGPNAADALILAYAVQEQRIVITIDTDFGELIYRDGHPHAGLIRLPDLKRDQRQDLLARLLAENPTAIQRRAIITCRRHGTSIVHEPPPAPPPEQ